MVKIIRIILINNNEHKTNWLLNNDKPTVVLSISVKLRGFILSISIRILEIFHCT